MSPLMDLQITIYKQKLLKSCCKTPQIRGLHFTFKNFYRLVLFIFLAFSVVDNSAYYLRTFFQNFSKARMAGSAKIFSLVCRISSQRWQEKLVEYDKERIKNVGDICKLIKASLSGICCDMLNFITSF